MADLQAPRGMSDVLPEDEPLWRFVRDTAERVARSFDYRLISTPIVDPRTRTQGRFNVWSAPFRASE